MITMLRVGLAAAAAVLLVGAGWSARGVVADRDMAEVQALHAQERERQAQAVQQAETKARKTEQARAEAIERIERESFTRNQAIAADAARARVAADSLRQHVARLAASGSAPSDPGTAAGGPPAGGAGLVLAELFGRADDRAGELAAFADAAHAAGLACERAYDAVRSAP